MAATSVLSQQSVRYLGSEHDVGLRQLRSNQMALATDPSQSQLLPKQMKGKKLDGVNMTSFLNLTVAAFVLFLLRHASIEMEKAKLLKV